MDIFSRFFAVPGALLLRWIDALGDTFLFLLEGLRQIFIAPKLFIKVLQQLYVIGTKSLFVICLIALFTGMVLGLQGYYVLVKFGSVGFLGAAVSLTLIRELGESQRILTRVTGRQPSVLCYPTGRYSDLTLEVAERYYNFGLKMVGGQYNTADDPFLVSRYYVSRYTGLDSFAAMVAPAGT